MLVLTISKKSSENSPSTTKKCALHNYTHTFTLTFFQGEKKLFVINKLKSYI